MPKLTLMRKTLVIFLLAGILPVAIVSILLFSTAADGLNDYAEEFMDSFNAQVSANLESFISDYSDMTMMVLVDSDLISDSDTVIQEYENRTELKKVLNRIMLLNGNIRNAVLMTTSGAFLQTGFDGTSVNEAAYRQLDWIRDIAESDAYLTLVPAHRTLYYDRHTDGFAVTFVRRILKYGTRYTGALVLDIDPSEILNLNEIYAGDITSGSVLVSIADAEGRIIYDSRLSEMEEGDDGFFHFTDFGSGYTTISRTTGAYTVYTAIPGGALVLRKTRVRDAAILLGILAAIGVSILAVYYSRSVTVPLTGLTEAMKKAEKRDYTWVYDEGRTDEVGDLIRGFNSMVTQTKDMISREFISEIQRKNARLFALQAQINPHMLFNTLESIRMKALLSGCKPVADMTKLLAKMFRTVLDSTEQNHTVADELNYVKMYMELQNMRSNGSYELSVNVDEELLGYDCIPILFQPIVENTVEHGGRADGQTVHISIEGEKRSDGYLSFRVSDDGCGMNPERYEKLVQELDEIRRTPETDKQLSSDGRRSIGCGNILRRLKLRYGRKESGDLQIISGSGSGTTVFICFPAKVGGLNEDTDSGR